MEREIRAAYPVDRLNDQHHVFFPSGFADPAASDPTLPGEQSITFGNDLPSAGAPPNRMIEPEEAITYELRNSDGSPGCPIVGDPGEWTVCRREGTPPEPDATFEPLVESVVPDGLTFEYLRNNMAPATAPDGTDIGVVRITLEVNVDDVEQTLTTDVDLRNRGG
jgi:hypothetical protein